MEGVAAAFRQLYHERGAWLRTSWLGTPVLKNPLDLWIYQEVLTRTRPDVIIETGTWDGGSALYLASICDLLDAGRVITIDIEERPGRPRHPRIDYVQGSSVDPGVVAGVRDRIADGEAVMAILDSDHSKEHVLAELNTYAPLITEDCYLIVEDTAATEIVPPIPGAASGEAVMAFLADDPPFTVDRDCEKFLMTWHPGGYLRRRARRDSSAMSVVA